MIVASVLAFVSLSGCSTRYDTNSHPYTEHMFQAPTLDISNYKSVQDRPNNLTDVSVVVAISGGGERAANFGVGALAELETVTHSDLNGNLLQEVDYFSTVSGGGMTVAAYLSALYSYQICGCQSSQPFSFNDAIAPSDIELDSRCKGKNVLDYYSMLDRDQHITDPCLRRHLERGYHNNIARALVNPKIIFSRRNRGDLLENAFAQELLGGQWNNHDILLGDIFLLKNTGDKQIYPHWFNNATVLENGALLPFTPKLLEEYRITGYVHKTEHIKILKSQTHLEFATNVPVSVGLSASGNFPLLIAPKTLDINSDDKNSYLHLLDGGISDNLGLTTAITILNQQPAEIKRRVLIVIDAFPGNFAPYSKNNSGPNTFLVLRRLPVMPMDGARGRIRERLDQLSHDTNTTYFYFSFDDLYRPCKTNLYKEDEDAAKLLFRDLKRYYPTAIRNDPDAILPIQNLKTYKNMTPFQIARNIDTSYNVKASEQDFLIAVGRYLVAKEASNIVSAMTTP